MKKLVGIAFVGMMALGCGGGSQKPADTAATPPPAAGTEQAPGAAPAPGADQAAPAPAPAQQ